jgi:rfaE bifunctional protein nucleotidyltransferase chain/domain
MNDTTEIRSARSKVKPIDKIADLCAAEQQNGKKIVLCHGVFDLVHMGHIRHLESALREGDILVVTVTADRHVNKGPGRPIFSQDMRAEMLAAIESVSWVGISDEPSSAAVLDTIRPDVYVKGSDYENPDEDITGKITEEREAAERHGGRLVYTKDITFSSSSLINRYLDVYDRPLRDFLEDLREKGIEDDIHALIDSVRNFKVLIVGDAIIDEYRYVDAMGKSAKENIIATRLRQSEMFAGGVFAAANHVAGICAEVEIVTCLGEKPSHESFIREHLKPNVRVAPVYRSDAPTTRKTRFLSRGYLGKLFEVYDFDDTPLPPPTQAQVDALVAERADKYDLVIVTDFGHGLIAPSTIDLLMAKAKFLAVNTQTNSANIGYNLITRYSRADYICVDAPEAQLATTDRFSELEQLVADKLSNTVDCSKFIVTHGQQGCVTFEKGGSPRRIPAFTKTVVDTVGAGDAFLSITSPLAAAGGPMELVGFVGNAAGAMKVGIVGHRRSIEKVPLLRYITTLLK